MSAKLETFFELQKVTDHDCGNYQIGEIDFVPLDKIAAYVEQYGEFGYREITDVCVRIMSIAREARNDHNRRSHGDAVCAGSVL